MANKIPELQPPQATDGLSWLRGWLEQLRLWIQTRDPRSTTVGDPLDKFTDRRELVAAGVLTRSSDGSFRGGSGTGGGTIVIGGGGGGSTYVPDLTPPPTPTGLAVAAGFSNLIITFDAPVYSVGHGNDLTRIYGAVWANGDLEPTFADVRTKLLTSGEGAQNVVSYSSELSTRWCIWATFVTRDGIEGDPAGGAHGVQATTALDVSALLDILTGQIRESELFATLGARITLIDGPNTLAGSVNKRLLEAQDYVNTQVGALQTQLDGLLANAQPYNNATAYAVDDLVTYLGGLYRALSATTGNLPSNATYWQKIGDYASLGDAVAAHTTQLSDHESRITSTEDGLAAEIIDRSLLATQVRGSYTGTDLASLSAGLLYSERQVRSTADTSQVLRLDSLEATVNNGATGVNATASALDLVEALVNNGATGVSATATKVSNLEASVNTAGTGLLARATVLEATTTNVDSGNTALAGKLLTLVSSIGATGSNRLRNSSVERVSSDPNRAAGWDEYNNYPGLEPSTLSLVPGRIGGQAQRITWSGSNTQTKGLVTADYYDGADIGGVIGGWMPGATYVVSWYARSSTSVGAGLGMQSAWNIGPATITVLLNPVLDIVAWRRYALRITWGGSVEPNGRLYISVAVGGGQTGHVEIDDVQVQEGSVLTGYSDGDQAVLSAALQQEATTRAALDGSVAALYTVRAEISAGGRSVVGGFGLSGTATATEGPRIDFGVRADRFYVDAPSGSGVTSSVVPFVVQTTTFTENGVSRPAGVYIDAAFVKNLTAVYATIGLLVADDIAAASISVAKLVAGSLQAGAYIQSTGFVSGVAGFRISGNGDAEFNNAIFRGTVVAAAGAIGGNVIGPDYLRSSNYVAATSGWQIKSNGEAEFDAVVIRGQINTGQIGAGAATSVSLFTGTGVLFSSVG